MTADVLTVGTAKRALVVGFLDTYRREFDTGASLDELSADVLADIVHVLVERHMAYGEPQDCALDLVGCDWQRAVGHVVAERGEE